MYFCPLCARVYGAPGACTEDGTPLERSGDSVRDPYAEDLVGRQIGSFFVERLIGRGGMGEVYLAVQPEIGSRVAIKLLARSVTSGPAVERFFSEARAVNLIRHEGLVNVTELSRLPDGRPYIVMEYLDGLPLSAHIAAGPFPLGTLARIMIDLLDVLAAVHGTGITHRDLKPDNIFITTLGRVKVLDFGIAKLKPELSSHGPETRTGALLGTPHYMSPEQARGVPADSRSDLYAVGVMMFECATGRRPFYADALYELLHLHVTAEAPSVLTLRADVPPALEALIRRALEKDPERRWQSAGEMAQALDEIARFLPPASFAPLAGVPQRMASLRPNSTLDATRLTNVVPAKKQTSSLPIFLTLGALAIVGIIAATIVLALWRRSPPVRVSEKADPNDPTHYDPTHFDPSAFLPAAKRMAAAEIPDAKLIGLGAMDVGADGTTKLGPDRVVSYLFQSAANTPKPTDAGLQPTAKCVVAVSVNDRRPFSVRAEGTCVNPYLLEPRCTVRQVVTRARLPAGQRATVTLTMLSGKNIWFVSVEQQPQTQIADDC